MSPDLKCECGSSLFSFSRVLETCPDGRSFELTSVDGLVPHIMILTCLKCEKRYAMGSRPQKEHNNTLMPLGSPEADAFIEAQRIPPNGEWTHDYAVDVPGQS